VSSAAETISYGPGGRSRVILEDDAAILSEKDDAGSPRG
jgi:hypothetical protein